MSQFSESDPVSFSCFFCSNLCQPCSEAFLWIVERQGWSTAQGRDPQTWLACESPPGASWAQPPPHWPAQTGPAAQTPQSTEGPKSEEESKCFS